MNQTMNRLLIAVALAGATLLGGCASSTKSASNALFDFGAPGNPAPAAGTPIATVVVADVTGSAALDSERMYYRLNYADPLQAHSYANSRWTSTPLAMLTQRFKVRFAQTGTKVLSTSDASTGVPLLRVDIDDFIHGFDSAGQSYGQVVLRASLFQGHRLVDQKTFNRKTSAASADAPGGARALAAATDAVAADISAWLATLPLRKE